MSPKIRPEKGCSDKLYQDFGVIRVEKLLILFRNVYYETTMIPSVSRLFSPVVSQFWSHRLRKIRKKITKIIPSDTQSAILPTQLSKLHTNKPKILVKFVVKSLFWPNFLDLWECYVKTSLKHFPRTRRVQFCQPGWKLSAQSPQLFCSKP